MLVLELACDPDCYVCAAARHTGEQHTEVCIIGLAQLDFDGDRPVDVVSQDVQSVGAHQHPHASGIRLKLQSKDLPKLRYVLSKPWSEIFNLVLPDIPTVDNADGCQFLSRH